MDRLADLVNGAFLLAVAWYGVVFVQASRASGVLAPVIDVAPWPVQAAIPLGFASAALRAAGHANRYRWALLMPAILLGGTLFPLLAVAMSSFEQQFGELVRAAVPFIVLMRGCLALIAGQPWIALALVR